MEPVSIQCKVLSHPVTIAEQEHLHKNADEEIMSGLVPMIRVEIRRDNGEEIWLSKKVANFLFTGTNCIFVLTAHQKASCGC